MKDLLLIPNILTLLRIFSIYPIIYLLSNSMYKAAIILLVFSLITDFFDGFLARKLDQSSQIGAILDPIADKLIVLFLFAFLLKNNTSPEWYYMIIFLRHVSQLSAVPVLLFWKKIYFKVKPKLFPKIATALNFIILFLYLASFVVSKEPVLSDKYFDYFESVFFNLLVFSFLVLSTILEVYILLTFIPRFIQIFKGEHDTFE